MPLADVFSPKPHIAGRSPCHNVQTGNVKGSPQVRIYAVAKRQKKLSVQFSAGAFHTPFPALHTMQITPREGPRKPPAPSLLRNIAKMEHQCFRDTFARFSGNFRPEKRKHRTSQGQTSEVLPRKYGGLWPRSPMFLTHFRTFSASFSRFSAGFSGKSARKPW